MRRKLRRRLRDWLLSQSSDEERREFVHGAFARMSESSRDMLRDDFNMVSTAYSLRKLKARGFAPERIADIGAFIGGWTRMAKSIFPDARVLMVDALSDKEPKLLEVEALYPGSVQHVIQLLGPAAAEGVPFFSMGTGSSVLAEQSNIDRERMELSMQCLDDVLDEAGCPAPELLKLDVQGYELQVLEGAKRSLPLAQVVILESALLQYNEGAPIVHDVLAFMSERGFVLYDIGEIMKSEAHAAVIQIDAIFVQRDSDWRPGFFDFDRTKVKASVHAAW